MNSEHPAFWLQEYLLSHQDDLVTHIIRFNELMSRYQAAIKEVTTKLEILKNDFYIRNRRNGIESIQCRIKKPASIVRKLNDRNIPISLDAIGSQLNDVAGIRVICPFIDDIYTVADLLAQQDDIFVVTTKDYIKSPKPNGYRSYHMIVEVPVFFTNAKELVRVEIQLRTVAMDFWASLEHQMKYKKDLGDCQDIIDELCQCAETIAQTDRRMLELRKQIESR